MPSVIVMNAHDLLLSCFPDFYASYLYSYEFSVAVHLYHQSDPDSSRFQVEYDIDFVDEFFKEETVSMSNLAKSTNDDT